MTYANALKSKVQNLNLYLKNKADVIYDNQKCFGTFVIKI